VLYVGAAAGIYRSADSGRTWQVVSPGPGVTVNTLAMNPANETMLYAGTAGGPVTTATNLWHSDDQGRTWYKFGLSLPASPERLIPAVTVLAVDPNRPEVLYVGTAGQGVYRFDLNRVGYELVGGVSLYNAHVKSVGVGANGRVYALTNSGLFVTKGGAWQRLEAVPEALVSLAVAPSNPQVLYGGSASSGAYRSRDGGQTWEPISAGLGLTPGAALRVTTLTVDEQDSQHLVVATAYGLGSHLAAAGIYESQDAGQQWAKLANLDELVTHLTFNKGAIYAATAKGLIRYGKPIEAAAVIPSLDLRSLANPTITQVLILILTLTLAGLVLMGRREGWLGLRRGHRRPTAS
jgi:photosystem II stability/assembly factor-like uncharacterized protein